MIVTALPQRIYSLKGKRSNPYKALVTVNGKPLEMEVDTGAAVSLISKKRLEAMHVPSSSYFQSLARPPHIYAIAYSGDWGNIRACPAQWVHRHSPVGGCRRQGPYTPRPGLAKEDQA